MQIKVLDDFYLTSVSGRIAKPKPDLLDSSNPLAELPGIWKGTGFNQIWRPFHGTQDRFLELNETVEVLQFDEIPGEIPNRGLLQADINLSGIRYLQQIQDAHALGPDGGKLPGIHIEPGLWINIPDTSNPSNPTTVARMASIPHGTTIVAQGTAFPIIPGPPPFAPVSIVPFTIAAPHTPIQFPETNLGIATSFRTPAADIPGVTQAMVNNPNSVLTNAVSGKNIVSTKTLRISTTPLNPPSSGGGTANIAFLQGAAGGPNAQSVQVDAIFWIEEIANEDGSTQLQLQYSQTVLLNFNGLSWPHVSVATLLKQPHL